MMLYSLRTDVCFSKLLRPCDINLILDSVGWNQRPVGGCGTGNEFDWRTWTPAVYVARCRKYCNNLGWTLVGSRNRLGNSCELL